MRSEGVDARIGVSEYFLLYASQRRLELTLTCISRQVYYAVQLLDIRLHHAGKFLLAELLAYAFLHGVVQPRVLRG